MSSRGTGVSVRNLIGALALGAAIAFASAGRAQDAAVSVDVPAFASAPPAASYRDRDDAARIRLAGIVDPASRDPYAQRLVTIARAVTRGHQSANFGQLEGAARDYGLAFTLAENDPFALRHVRWSYGWSLLALGEPRAALAQWQAARELHGGAPFWYAYTVAVGLWAAGDHALALDYYEQAVRSSPAWGTIRGQRQLTAHWRRHEKEAAGELFRAWRETRPPAES